MAVNPVFQFFQPGVFDIVSQEQDFGGVVHPPVLLLSYVDYILHVGEAFALQMSALAGFQFRQHGIGHLHEVAVFFAVDDAERVHIRVLAQVFQFGLFVIGVYRYVDGAYFGAGVQQGQPVRHICRPDAHVCSPFHADSDKSFCHVVYPAVELAPSEAQVAVGVNNVFFVRCSCGPMLQPLAKRSFV